MDKFPETMFWVYPLSKSSQRVGQLNKTRLQATMTVVDKNSQGLGQSVFLNLPPILHFCKDEKVQRSSRETMRAQSSSLFLHIWIDLACTGSRNQQGPQVSSFCLVSRWSLHLLLESLNSLWTDVSQPECKPLLPPSGWKYYMSPMSYPQHISTATSLLQEQVNHKSTSSSHLERCKQSHL